MCTRSQSDAKVRSVVSRLLLAPSTLCAVSACLLPPALRRLPLASLTCRRTRSYSSSAPAVSASPASRARCNASLGRCVATRGRGDEERINHGGIRISYPPPRIPLPLTFPCRFPRRLTHVRAVCACFRAFPLRCTLVPPSCALPRRVVFLSSRSLSHTVLGCPI